MTTNVKIDIRRFFFYVYDVIQKERTNGKAAVKQSTFVYRDYFLDS